MNGIINLFFPFLNFFDDVLTMVNLNLFLRILLWGVISGVIATWLYVLVSDQSVLRNQKHSLKVLRAHLANAQDGEFDEILNLSLKNLKQSLLLLKMVLWPTLVSSTPVLVIILWLSAFHSYRLPSHDILSIELLSPIGQIEVMPPESIVKRDGRVVNLSIDNSSSIRFYDDNGVVYEGIPASPPIPFVYPWHWWNIVLGNEAGYLRSGSQLEAIHFQYEPKVLLSGVPEWISNWQFPYILGLTSTAFGLRLKFKIE